jgi:hypothetical protein
VIQERRPRRVFVAADIPRLLLEVDGARQHLSQSVKAMLRSS